MHAKLIKEVSLNMLKNLASIYRTYDNLMPLKFSCDRIFMVGVFFVFGLGCNWTDFFHDCVPQESVVTTENY